MSRNLLMHTRPIAYNELAAFAAYSDAAAQNADFRAYLVEQIGGGFTRPAWCFVAEDERGICGRVVYWALPPAAHPLLIDFLDLPWEDDYLAVGAALLGSSLDSFPDAVNGIEYQLQIPATWHRFPEQRHQVLTSGGFVVRGEGVRWELASDAPLATLHQRLVFRDLREVGDPAFVDAIERVSVGSLDRSVQQEQARRGEGAAARSAFADLQSLVSTPEWWHLAYTPAGALVGLVMPVENDGGPVIGYIGVVPEQRGRGYAHAVLARGTATLQALGAQHIRADTDAGNAPMIAVFRRAGYRQFATWREYWLGFSDRL